MNQYNIKEISAEECYSLRLLVLKPHHFEYEYQYPGDFDSSTFHLGAIENYKPVCIASFFENVHPLIGNLPSIQLRGMATHPNWNGKGLGRALVEEAKRICKEKGVEILWCNARKGACGFYQKLGFEILSDEFEVPTIGPHYVMKINLNA